MRKRTLLINIIVLTGALLFFLLWIIGDNAGLLNGNLEIPSVKVYANNGKEEIHPWYNESDDCFYYFLPAFAQECEYYAEQMPEFDVKFLKSENIPAVFITTESGSMEYLVADKENEEPGEIRIINAGGEHEYSGAMEKISGRGNTSWEKYNKKPYTISLKESAPLLQMGNGKRWYLLPVWREGNRMNTKVVFDIAEALGLEYTPQCTWIDLYFNGEYAGNYLLCEAVSVGKVRVDVFDLEKENQTINGNLQESDTFDEGGRKGYEIQNGPDVTGGYLIEKDLAAYYAEEKCGFITESGKQFTIGAPKHASRQQVSYIAEYVQMIENLILSHNTEYANYIDLDSFAARFLVDEISLNCDANITSMFFYKDRNDDLLYAGPVWDYDSAMGDLNSGWMAGGAVNYRNTTLSDFRSSEDTLGWYVSMYEDEIFYEEICRIYEQALPQIETILETQIDQYADLIRASAQMDLIRWQNEDKRDDYPGHYQSFDNNVRYLKYFLANRLNYLNERWEIAYTQFEAPGNGETHQVTFRNGEDIVEVRQVQDGEVILDPPYLDGEVYWGWYYEHSVEKLRDQIPVYEDVVLFAREK